MRRLLLPGIVVALLALCCVGCQPDPVERTIDRLDALTALLDVHKDNPDTLLNELERFVGEHEEAWTEDRAVIEAMDEEAQKRLESKHERALHRSVGRFMEVSLDVQARLKDDPSKLSKYLELLSRVR